MKVNKYIPLKIRKKTLQRDNFTCQKCGFQDLSSEELELHHIRPRVLGGEDFEENLVTLCFICHNYAPDSEEEFKSYINEKIDGKILNTFRKAFFSTTKKTKRGMINKFNQGIHITKAPKGYKMIDKKLVPYPEQEREVKQIFNEFLNLDISLTKLAKKYNMTTAGIKKLLINTTYLGRVKFAKKESEGQHEPIIDKNLFEQIQNKLKNKGVI